MNRAGFGKAHVPSSWDCVCSLALLLAIAELMLWFTAFSGFVGGRCHRDKLPGEMPRLAKVFGGLTYMELVTPLTRSHRKP